MANYYGVGRTNYFKVKDPDAFKKALLYLSGIRFDQKSDGSFVLMDDNPDGGGWNVCHEMTGVDDPADWEHCVVDEGEGPGDVDTIDISLFIAPFLAEGEVAVVQEVGHEKYRYLIGWATAVDWRGNTKTVSIDDIYLWADTVAGRGVSPASY